MIQASEARMNVINYEVAMQMEIKNKVKEQMDIINRSIEYHSKNGFSSATFYPYEKSRFITAKSVEYAHELIQELLEDAGYTVLENNCIDNIIKIEW